LKPKAQKGKSGERSRAEQARVLVITDEPDVSYRQSLERSGLEVVGVSGGPAALISLHRYRPQLVIASSEIKGLAISDLARTLTRTEEGLLPMIVVGSEVSTLARRYAASDAALYVAKNEGRNRVAVAPLLQQTLPGV
jgi:PleD family two-component response regulator